jgi:phage major head subunit gpT-like protein
MKYDEYPVEHLDIFDKNTSDKAFEEDVGTAGFGLAPVKTEGGNISYDTAEQAFIDRYTHTTYGLGFIITREMMEDGVGGTTALKRAGALAFSIRQTAETVAANVLNRAFNSSYTFGDGVELCSTAHPNQSGGTWKNEPDTAVDLSEAALEQACIDIAGFTNDRGLKIAVRPMKLIIPRQLVFEASRILNSDLRVGTGDNDVNALKKSGMIGEVVVNHYLTDADAWFIKTDCPEGMKYFERRSPSFATENDFDTENARFKATFRASWGCTDKRAIYGTPGA